MQSIQISASRTYDVRIGSGLLEKTGEWAAELIKGRNCVIISDSVVWPLYGKRTAESLERAGFQTSQFVFPAGEASKNPQVLLEAVSFLAQREITREDLVVALGGGVTGDMGGLAAALFLRGTPCIQIPTSLLAMVDSSVGGKTAVDLPEGKNLLGTFTQPYLVNCDTDLLRTLAPEVFREGMAEVIKYGMIASPELLRILDGAPELSGTAEGEEQKLLEDIIARGVEIKRAVVDEDERDLGGRQILNFGHTLGHAIERCMGFSIYHGQGVAIGMSILTRAAVREKLCPAECAEVLGRLLEKYHLPETTDLPAEKLIEAAHADKKRRGSGITLVLPERFGRCALKKTDYAYLRALLDLGRDA